MRYVIAEKNIGGREESWFYLEYDDASQGAWLVHEWENWYPGRPMDRGEIKWLLPLTGHDRYRTEAIEIMRANHPDWPGFLNL